MTNLYQKLYQKLNSDRLHWATEEEVRVGWLKHLENELDIRFHVERARNDACYNQVIIEFKNKGLFRGSSTSSAYKEAIYDRLQKYIIRRSQEEGIPKEEYIGIAIDGDHIVFAFFREDIIYPRDILPFNQTSVNLVAQACKDSKRKALTAANLIEDFGYHSRVSQIFMAGLVHELENHISIPGNNKIKMIFEEWMFLFGQVADLSVAQTQKIKQQLPINMAVDDKNKVAGVLFVIHTYNAFVIKILAAEIISEYGLTAHSHFCQSLVSYNDNDLLYKLRKDIEQNNFFADARIKGFVEEAIFSWYVDHGLTEEGKALICEGVRELLTQLSLYRMDNLGAARSRDVLKALYQSLVPEILRKTLGEFYTPDWLVDVTCDRADLDDWLGVRVLDPTCGSGSFLLEAVRRKRDRANAQHLTEEETLQEVLNTVWGFDLNPLAVQTSRVNFLISVADLIASTKAEVEIPVLLADAVYSPAHTFAKNKDIVEYQIGGEQSNLNIFLPDTLIFDRLRLERIFDAMTDSLEEEIGYDEVENILTQRNIISQEEAKEWQNPLSVTYNQVLHLHKKSWNGIWFKIIRNFFWSAVTEKFDLIVGNPPWVRWSNLPERYRERIKSTCEQYAIFSETPYHGGNELDISGMLTYTVGDKWLKIGGTLVFVITQTHFQSSSSQGFRNFKINENTNFLPIEIDDLKKLRPFPKVANKTAILHLRKVLSSTNPQYPVTYRLWHKGNSRSGTIPENASKSEVMDQVEIDHWEANPINGGNSPWAILPPGRFGDMEMLQGESDWITGRKGATADLNGIYMVRLLDVNNRENLVQIQTRPEAGRTDIGVARKFWIEPNLLYPLLKGAGDFSACDLHVKEQLYILVPNAGIAQSAYDDAKQKMDRLHQTSKYFEMYKNLLEQRSTYRLRQKNAPYFSIYNVGSYTFAPYKVVWAELSTKFEAVVVEDFEIPFIGNRPYVPDHKIYFAAFDNKEVAYFVCGLLNSRLVQEYVMSHTIQIQVSNIFKHLRLPRYIARNNAHQELVRLCYLAHSENKLSEKDKILKIMAEMAEKIMEQNY